MKLYFIKLHLITLLLALVGILPFVFYFLGVLNIWVSVILSAIFFCSATIMFWNVIPYLFFKKMLVETNSSLNFKYYPFSLKLLNELKGIKFANVKTFRTIDPFMPALLLKSEEKYIIISIHQIYFSLISRWDWVEKYLRKKIVIEIITPTNLKELVEVSFETLDGTIIPEDYDHTILRGKLREIFKNTGLEKRGYIAYGPNSFVIQYTGFCNDPSKIIRWLKLANKFIDEQNLK